MTTYNKIFLTVIIAVSSLTNLSAMKEEQEDFDETTIALFKLVEIGGSVEEVQKLIKQGVNVHAKNKYGDTVLIWAVRNGYLAVCKALIENGAEVNVKNYYGHTALILAMEHGDFAVCKLLVEHDADVNIKNKDGDTALHWAIRKDHSFTVCNLLVAHGADVNIKNKVGNTALFDAIEQRNLDVCNLLVEHGADVNIKNMSDYETLVWAIEYGNFEICQLLIENAADVNAKDEWGETALFVAIERLNLDVGNLLAEHGAAFNIINNDQQSALCLAAEKGHTELCKSMIEKACLACPSSEEVKLSRARFMKALLCLEKRGMHKNLWFEILSIDPESKGGFIAVLYYDLCNGYGVGERFNLLSNKLYEYTIGELKIFMDQASKDIDDSNVELKSILDSTVLEENFGKVIRTNINQRLGLMNVQAQEKIVKQEEL